MASHKIFSLFFITFLYSSSAQTEPNHLIPMCFRNKTFAANSSFQSNLITLFSSLASNKTSNTEFYNTTVGGGGDTIYGFFMCRGDVTLQLCHQCVVNSTQRLTSDPDCRFSKEAVYWRDPCLVRYSDRYIFSTMDTKPRHRMLNPNNVSNQAGFMNLLVSTMNDAADAAAKPALGKKKFATKEANVEFQTMYCLVQCTPDILPEDCTRCLRSAIGDLHWCCEGKIGGRIMYPSCAVRYELYSFYNSSVAPTLALSPPTNSSDTQGKGQSTKTVVIVVVSLVGAGIFSCLVYYLLRTQMKKRRMAILRQKYFGSESSTLEPLQFSLATIEAATKFSHENCLGQGGFGQVYKGILSNGQEIAVKRLLKGSGQGAKEFRNEVLLIARLQHRNLVALLGFCIEEQEKILIYEYVSNGSLDYFLFVTARDFYIGSPKSRVLNWKERCKIIGGVARGILYLHDYSHVKIIYRDLKPSNILLDDEMNLKISDFGLAKIVTFNENEGSTNKIVGTYGYMSPEYVMFGQYSEKSDIFSFGVIVLEIISGKKNAGAQDQSQYSDSLISYVWNQWRDEKLLEMLDSNLKEFGSYNEVNKCIQIGLLCVQEDPEVRPSMATVVSYLNNDTIQLPIPQETVFFLEGRMELATGSKE